jgi:YVTN family beta-propeller protein
LKKLAFLGFLISSLLVFSGVAWAAVSTDTRVPLGGTNGPYNVVVNHDGSHVYATTNNTTSIFRIRTSDNSVTSSFNLGTAASSMALSPDGTKLFVSISGNEIVVLNPSTLNLIQSIGLSFTPLGMDVTPNGNFLYVVGLNSNRLFKISTATYAVSEIALSPLLSVPESITINPNGQVAYINNFSGGTISVINLATDSTQNTINVGGNPLRVSISPNGGYLATADEGTNKVSIISTQSNQVIQTLQSPSGSQPRFSSFSPDGSTLAVSQYAARNILLYDTATWTLTQTLTPSQTTLVGALSFTPNGSTLWASGQSNSALFRWEFTPPLSASTPTPSPSPTSTSPSTSSLPATGSSYLTTLVGFGVIALFAGVSVLTMKKVRQRIKE